MAYYRSSYNAADERAKHIQEYIAAFNNSGLSEAQRNNLIIFGNSILNDILLNTDYIDRLDNLNKKIHNLEETRKKKLSKSIRANQILKLQMEYITKAGVFGRPQLKVVSPSDDGKEDEILKILEEDIFEDATTDADSVE